MKTTTSVKNQFSPDQYYLTDGGLETTLIYHHGIDLPHFAAFELLMRKEGREALRRYFRPYLDISRRYGLRFILETPTWRANNDWGFKLGYAAGDLDNINRYAVHFLRELQSEANNPGNLLVSGNIGPRGDGYVIDKAMTAGEARRYHQRQIGIFAEEQVDVVTAMTLNYSNEAIGIARAAAEAGVPAVIAFTVETDGRLPSGETLREAIQSTDQQTGGYPLHYMINCAHPEHFRHILSDRGEWKARIRGIRANASTKSHAELDESTTLDAGDKALLSQGYAELQTLLPNLRVFGGCCGTDHSHMEAVCETMFAAV